MRRRLVAYFDRKNCLSPDELADETLNRVSRRLDEEGSIDTETPAKYCYIVARYVFLEHVRAGNGNVVAIDDYLAGPKSLKLAMPEDPEADRREEMLSCLDECSARLERSEREMILQYYVGEEREKIDNRRSLAEKLGISANALSIRACRIRRRIEECVRNCIAGR
jgi:DNA-directed RNA polymerase specialized sigma24 family protein